MTEAKTLPARSAIADAHKWNAESVFPNRAAWSAEFQAINEALP